MSPDLSHIFPLERILRGWPEWAQGVFVIGFVLAVFVLGAVLDGVPQ